MPQGIDVFHTPGLLPENYKPVLKTELLARAANDWDRWGLQGKAFFKGALFYLDNKNYRLAAFHLHQAAESTLIAFIKAHSGYRQSSHNLSRSLRLTLLFTDELKDVFELDTTDGAQLFNFLQSAYSEARYKYEFAPDEDTIKLIVPKVQLLLQRAENICLKYIEGQD